MAKYRKKPVVIEAITFDELVEYGIASGAWCHNGMPWSFNYETTRETDTGPVIVHHPITHENDDCYLIPTLEGTMKMQRGDMLITGVKGEIYPCKPDIFAATYEPAGAGAASTPRPAGEAGKPNALDFLRRATDGTCRVVCTGDLTLHQIAEAGVKGRMFVADDGIGWALLPWELTTDKDQQRFGLAALQPPSGTGGHAVQAVIDAAREWPTTKDGVPLRLGMKVWYSSDPDEYLTVAAIRVGENPEVYSTDGDDIGPLDAEDGGTRAWSSPEAAALAALSTGGDAEGAEAVTPKEIVTEADVLRSWLIATSGHPNNCGCGACCYPVEEFTIPPFADHSGDSPSNGPE